MKHFRLGMGIVLPILLVLLTANFAEYAFDRGMHMNAPQEALYSRLHHGGEWVSNLAIYGHMVVGAGLTVLAPLQLIGPFRRRLPIIHRCVGYATVGFAVLAASGGLLYIFLQGTIGGIVMDVGFGFYGLLVGIVALQTVRFARKKDPRHHEWGLRLVILALGSWLFRVHYALWDAFTGGLYTSPDFTGGFDIVQTFAFYLPYLFLLEIWIVCRRRSEAEDLIS